jgi:hypothetical protein
VFSGVLGMESAPRRRVVLPPTLCLKEKGRVSENAAVAAHILPLFSLPKETMFSASEGRAIVLPITGHGEC